MLSLEQGDGNVGKMLTNLIFKEVDDSLINKLVVQY